MSDYKIKKINTDVDCEISIEVELKSKAIEENKSEALKRINENVKVDGFRPGHIPEKVLIEKVGDYAITEEACRICIDKNFLNIIQDSKHFPINQPSISITKLAVGSDADIKIEFAIQPVVDLVDYKKIAKKHNSEKEKEKIEEVSDEEIEKVLTNLRMEVAHFEYHQNHHDHDHNHGELEPVELNDEFAKKVGPFENVDDLKKAIRENLSQSKNQKTIEKNRIKLVDEIIEKSKIKYPELLLQSELQIMIEELKADLNQMGQTFDEYLKVINKTEADLREERKEMAAKRVKTQLVLSKIAGEEKLKADESLVNTQVDQILKTHVGADKENVRMFVERFELNKMVWELLEGVK